MYVNSINTFAKNAPPQKNNKKKQKTKNRPPPKKPNKQETKDMKIQAG